MNIDTLKALVRRKAQAESLQSFDTMKMSNLEPVLRNVDIRSYLQHCIAPHSYIASGVTILSLEDICGYTAEGCSPGGYLLPFGYLTIAVNIGGNAICFGADDGGVYWADHVTFTSTITYRDRTTDDWEEWGEYTPEKVRRALVRLDDSIESFLQRLLADQLTAQLKALD